MQCPLRFRWFCLCHRMVSLCHRSDFLSLPPILAQDFRRGDSNRNLAVTIGDVVYTVANLFVLGSSPHLCEDAVDADNNGQIDFRDPVRIFTWLFGDADDPAGPGPTGCGPASGLGEALGCLNYPLFCQPFGDPLPVPNMGFQVVAPVTIEGAPVSG